MKENPNLISQDTDKGIRFLPMKEEYYPEILKILEDKETREMLGVIRLPRYESFKRDDILNYVIINQEDKLVGKVELFEISWRNRRAQLSVMISSEYRGQGYAKFGISRILDIGFRELGLHRIWLRVLEYNQTALELYKRLGFKIEGICRDESFRRGKFWDQIQMSILASDWLERGSVDSKIE